MCVDRGLCTTYCTYRSLAVAVGDVGSHARGVDDVKQRQVLDLPGQLEEERHGLPDATRRTHHGHLATANTRTNETGKGRAAEGSPKCGDKERHHTRTSVCGWVNCATFIESGALQRSSPLQYIAIGMQLTSGYTP